MPALTERQKKEWQFFLDDKDKKIIYNEECQKCSEDCKQSRHVTIVNCPKRK